MHEDPVIDNMVKKAIEHIEYVHTKIRFSVKKVSLAHALSEHGPYEDFYEVWARYGGIQNPRLQESMNALKGRLNRQFRQLISVATIWHDELFDKRPELGQKFYTVYRVLSDQGYEYDIPPILLQRLVAVKLAYTSE